MKYPLFMESVLFCLKYDLLKYDGNIKVRLDAMQNTEKYVEPQVDSTFLSSPGVHPLLRFTSYGIEP
ncbi:MAG TPA: hypothetical protein VFS97_09990 [Nitrososphaeraceae archaeon]|nr:hypothetical protein [Nitrososphaeraceae archaeon]